VRKNLVVIERAHAEGRLGEVLLEAVDLSVENADRFGVARTFRWHSDGDIFSEWYARAIRRVALARPEVTFWIYTRSFLPGASFVGALVGPRRPENLHVFLSVDRHNVDAAAGKLAQFSGHGVRAAVLADTDIERTELEFKLGIQSVVCPATRKYRNDRHGFSFLTDLDGRRSTMPTSEIAQGACAACRFCLRDDERSVTFMRHGYDRTQEAAVNIIRRRNAA
jgi:hypothetical protein